MRKFKTFWEKSMLEEKIELVDMSLVCLITIFIPSYLLIRKKNMFTSPYSFLVFDVFIVIVYLGIPISIKISNFGYIKKHIFLFCTQIVEIILYVIYVIIYIIFKCSFSFVTFFANYITEDLIIYIILILRVIQFFYLQVIIYRNSKTSLKKWLNIDYIGYGKKLKDDLKDIISKDFLWEHHNKLRDIEYRILNKFKTRENLIREKFLISKKTYFFENFNLINIVLVILGILFTIISPLVTIVTAVEKEKSWDFLIKYFSSIKEIPLLFLLFGVVVFLVFYYIGELIMYKDKKRYLKLLDYVIDNYRVLCKKYNIKPIQYNGAILSTICIDYDTDSIKLDGFKNFLDFLESNGINILFFSRENENKIIEKGLKVKNLYSFDFTILGKKEIENFKIENNKFWQIVSEKLGIFENEMLVLSKSKGTKFKIELLDSKNASIKAFKNLKEVLKFLQSKME